MMKEVDGDINVVCPYCGFKDCFIFDYNIYEGVETSCALCGKNYRVVLSQIKM